MESTRQSVSYSSSSAWARIARRLRKVRLSASSWYRIRGQVSFYGTNKKGGTINRGTSVEPMH